MSNVLIANRYGHSQRHRAANGQLRSLSQREYAAIGLQVASALLERTNLAQLAGFQYGTDRDLYKVLGYKLQEEITFDHYKAHYERSDVAARIIDYPAQSTWRKPPTVLDGTDEGDAVTDTPFVDKWNELVKKRRIWHYFERVDRLSGIGRYGVLVIGVRDGVQGEQALAQPMGDLNSVDDVLYLSAFSEGSADVKELERDPANERFGLPTLYSIDFSGEVDGGVTGKAGQLVHWSRIIHVAEDLLDDEVYGRPRLQRVLNRLDDLMKIVGGSAEATWKLMRKGFVLDVSPEYQDFTTDQVSDLEDQLEEFDHGLRRFLRTRGLNVQDLGSDVVDPTGMFDIIMALISAACGIPQRILMGSERGELASTQDQINWAAFIESRQESYAEPQIARMFIDRLIEQGALPEPTNGDYILNWPSLFGLTALEVAELNKLKAQTAQAVAPFQQTDMIVTPQEARTKWLDLPAEPEMMAANKRLNDFEQVMANQSGSMQDRIEQMSQEAQELINDTRREFARARQERQRRNTETLGAIPQTEWDEALRNSQETEV